MMWIKQPIYRNENTGWTESIQRAYSIHYQQLASKRKHPIIFENIPALERLVEDIHLKLDEDDLHTAKGKKRAHDRLVEIEKHLKDASDEECPQQLRIEHFDIVGGIVWDLMCEEHVLQNCVELDRLLYLWQQSNGV